MKENAFSVHQEIVRLIALNYFKVWLSENLPSSFLFSEFEENLNNMRRLSIPPDICSEAIYTSTLNSADPLTAFKNVGEFFGKAVLPFAEDPTPISGYAEDIYRSIIGLFKTSQQREMRHFISGYAGVQPRN